MSPTLLRTTAGHAGAPSKVLRYEAAAATAPPPARGGGNHRLPSAGCSHV